MNVLWHFLIRLFCRITTVCRLKIFNHFAFPCICQEFLLTYLGMVELILVVFAPSNCISYRRNKCYFKAPLYGSFWALIYLLPPFCWIVGCFCRLYFSISDHRVAFSVSPHFFFSFSKLQPSTIFSIKLTMVWYRVDFKLMMAPLSLIMRASYGASIHHECTKSEASSTFVIFMVSVVLQHVISMVGSRICSIMAIIHGQNHAWCWPDNTKGVSPDSIFDKMPRIKLMA